MTAIKKRRSRATMIAIGLTLASLVAAAGLAYVGVQTLFDLRTGRLAEGQTVAVPTRRLPFTPTALVGTVDDLGRLTTIVVLTIEPDGTGGSIVQLAASADADSGNTGVLRPLNAVLTVQGPDEFRLAAESLTGLSFDVVEIVDEQRFGQIVSRLGDLPVQFPTALYDASSGEQWEAGADVIGPPVAARVVTATDPSVADWSFEPARAAVWAGIADRVGAGIGSAAPVASDVDLPQIDNLDAFLARLFAGPIIHRSLAVRPISAERVAEQLPADLGAAFGAVAADAVAVHDRAEALMVLGAVAPARVGAPLAAPNFRVVAGYDEAALEALEVRGSDVLKQAIDRLLFAQTNVVSVAELAGFDVPEHTVIEVADPSTIDGVREQYADAFGDEIEVRAAAVTIDGVDIELILGRDFLDRVVAPTPVGVAGSGNDDSDA